MQIENPHRVFAPGIPHVPTISKLFTSRELADEYKADLLGRFPRADIRVEKANAEGKFI
jgi:hypothetical protein